MHPAGGVTIATSIRSVSLTDGETELLLSWIAKPLRALRLKIQTASHDDPVRLSLSEKKLLAMHVNWGLSESPSRFTEGSGLRALQLELEHDTRRAGSRQHQ